MSYKIIADSCCEFPEEYKEDPRFVNIPLGLDVAGEQLWDDETFDQASFLQKVASSKTCPRSCCPSPEKYMRAYDTDAENIFVFTLSSKLSGSYNSAVIGKTLYEEKHGEKNIFVCDSHSASVGETQLALKAAKWSEEGLPFAEICEKLLAFRDEMKTYFVLDNLETLRKNGRLTGVKALVASTLSIKPVMAGREGEIEKQAQAVGMKKALAKMAELMLHEVPDTAKRVLMISHCNCKDRAEYVKKLFLAKASFEKVYILDTAGISSMYANDGGIIVTL